MQMSWGQRFDSDSDFEYKIKFRIIFHIKNSSDIADASQGQRFSNTFLSTEKNLFWLENSP